MGKEKKGSQAPQKEKTLGIWIKFQRFKIFLDFPHKKILRLLRTGFLIIHAIIADTKLSIGDGFVRGKEKRLYMCRTI